MLICDACSNGRFSYCASGNVNITRSNPEIEMSAERIQEEIGFLFSVPEGAWCQSRCEIEGFMISLDSYSEKPVHIMPVEVFG